MAYINCGWKYKIVFFKLELWWPVTLIISRAENSKVVLERLIIIFIDTEWTHFDCLSIIGIVQTYLLLILILFQVLRLIMKISSKFVHFYIIQFLRIILRAFFFSASLVYYNYTILFVLIHKWSLILVFVWEGSVESISLGLGNPLLSSHVTFNLEMLVFVNWIIVYFRHRISQIWFCKFLEFLHFFIECFFLTVFLNFKPVSKISPWDAAAWVFFELI